MRVAFYIEDGYVFAQLHLSSEEKRVLRENRHLLGRVVLDRTPRNFEQQRQRERERGTDLRDEVARAREEYGRRKSEWHRDPDDTVWEPSWVKRRRDPKIQEAWRQLEDARRRANKH